MASPCNPLDCSAGGGADGKRLFIELTNCHCDACVRLPRHLVTPPCPTPLNHCARCHVEPRRALTESRTENHFTCCRHRRPVPVPICGSQRTAAKRPQIGSHHLVTRNCQRVQATGNWQLGPGTRHQAPMAATACELASLEERV